LGVSGPKTHLMLCLVSIYVQRTLKAYYGHNTKVTVRRSKEKDKANIAKKTIRLRRPKKIIKLESMVAWEIWVVKVSLTQK
jgi:hypothetical protein